MEKKLVNGNDAELNILYCSDAHYAPYCGVSMLSLLESNARAARITVYLVSDAIAAGDLERLGAMFGAFGESRRLVIVDGKKTVEQLRGMSIFAYRGSQAANLRLLFPNYIDPDVKRLLYLDCDTIVTDDLCELFATEMGTCPVAVVRDALTGFYKRLLGFSADEPYFNSGVILFDVENWQKADCNDRLRCFMSEPCYRGVNIDQDYLNYLLRGQLVLLAPRYNFQTPHQLVSERTYFSATPQVSYYTNEELNAARQHPAILHAYRFLGQFPWSQNSMHPAKSIFSAVAARSPWRDMTEPAVHNAIFGVERFLFRVLPQRIFFRLFILMQNRYFRQEWKKIHPDGQCVYLPEKGTI